MEYREFAPLPGVAAAVHCIWTLAGHAREMNGDAQPVLPDGHPELVIHLGDAFERIANSVTGVPDGMSGAEPQPLILFAGQLTEQLTLRPTGRMAVVGIRFRPFGVAALLRTPQCDLTGLTLGIDDLDPRLAAELSAVRDRTDSVAEAAILAQHVLCQWMDPGRIDSRVRAAVDAIVRTGGLIGMGEVSRIAEMTRRHLERRFRTDVGFSPKRFARISRFQRAVRILENADDLSPGTTTAAACGYADQSHFIRDFRDLAGCSPAQHLLRNGQLTGFFINRH